MSSLEELYQAIIEGRQVGEELTRRALDEGAAPMDVLSKAVTPAMAIVGGKMEAGEYFIPEVLFSARVAQQAAGVVKPLLKKGSGAKVAGRVVLGTVEGDLHSIGKDLVKMMLEAAGFEVTDLGIDVSPHQFVAAAQENRADIVAMSALLTTTMPTMGDVIEGLVEAGFRDHVKVLVGGAPVTQHFADQIGADGYGPSAAAAARLAQGWVSSND